MEECLSIMSKSCDIDIWEKETKILVKVTRLLNKL